MNVLVMNIELHGIVVVIQASSVGGNQVRHGVLSSLWRFSTLDLASLHLFEQVVPQLFID